MIRSTFIVYHFSVPCCAGKIPTLLTCAVSISRDFSSKDCRKSHSTFIKFCFYDKDLCVLVLNILQLSDGKKACSGAFLKKKGPPSQLNSRVIYHTPIQRNLILKATAGEFINSGSEIIPKWVW